MPVAGVEGDQQGPALRVRDAGPGYTSPKPGKRVWLIDSRANHYPAQVRRPGSSLTPLHDPHRHDRQRLTLSAPRAESAASAHTLANKSAGYFILKKGS